MLGRSRDHAAGRHRIVQTADVVVQTLILPRAIHSSVNAMRATAATPKNMQMMKIVCSTGLLLARQECAQASRVAVAPIVIQADRPMPVKRANSDPCPPLA